jgi:hypothetical protein
MRLARAAPLAEGRMVLLAQDVRPALAPGRHASPAVSSMRLPMASLTDLPAQVTYWNAG